MTTDGQMGEMPKWYRLVKAAQYLGVPVWELEQRSWQYVRQAEEAQQAEAMSRQNTTTVPSS